MRASQASVHLRGSAPSPRFKTSRLTYIWLHDSAISMQLDWRCRAGAWVANHLEPAALLASSGV